MALTAHKDLDCDSWKCDSLVAKLYEKGFLTMRLGAFFFCQIVFQYRAQTAFALSVAPPFCCLKLLKQVVESLSHELRELRHDLVFEN